MQSPLDIFQRFNMGTRFHPVAEFTRNENNNFDSRNDYPAIIAQGAFCKEDGINVWC